MKWTGPKIDLTKLPSDRLEARIRLFLGGITERALASADFAKTEFADRELLYKCMEFIDLHFLDGVPGDAETLNRIWFFPWTEAQMELGEALSLALIGSYKAACDHLRRTLELNAVGFFLTAESVEREKALNWMRSKENTPFFSMVVEKLPKYYAFGSFQESERWTNDIKGFYWQLSDITHIKGTAKSFFALDRSGNMINSVRMPNVHESTLRKFFDLYISTVRHIATLLALCRPILLEGLPLLEKFGLNEPISGFYTNGQASLLCELVLDIHRSFCEELRKKDIEVQSILEWIENMPDITEEQFKQQVEEFESWLASQGPKRE